MMSDGSKSEKGNFYGHETNGEKSGARDENFFESLFLCLCPTISIKQFIVIISLVEFLVFIVTLIPYGLDNSAFLAPNGDALSYGWSDTKKIRNDWQLWRFFTPTLLHGHFEHICGNVVAQLYMGAGIEYGLGFIRMTILYVLSGLGGITLSMCVRPQAHGVGASTAVFGLVGYFLAYLFTNWSYMGRKRYGQRIFLLIYVIVMILLNLNIGPNSDSHIDNFGHLGGFISGLLLGFAINEQYDADARNAEPERTPDRFTDEEYAEQSGCRKSCVCTRCGLFFVIAWYLALFIYFYAFMDIDFEENPDDS